MPVKGVERDFWCGDSIRFVVSNRPYIDPTVPPDLNDYRWAESTNIKIYDPSGELILDEDMCRTERIGWYVYTYQTDCSATCGIGVYRVDVTLCSTIVDECFTTQTTGSSGSIGTSGTSGSSSQCCDVAVSYFRINDRERF